MNQIIGIDIVRVFTNATIVTGPSWDNCTFTIRTVNATNFGIVFMTTQDEMTLTLQSGLYVSAVKFGLPIKWVVQYDDTQVGVGNFSQRIVNLWFTHKREPIIVDPFLLILVSGTHPSRVES